MQKNIYELELFEIHTIHFDQTIDETMKRVPGGWIYLYRTSNDGIEKATSEFIPFNNEFQETKSK